MSNPADNNAPPGGGPGAVVVAATATTQPTAPAAIPPNATAPTPQTPPVDDPTKLLQLGDGNADGKDGTKPPAKTTASESIPDLGDPGLNVAADYFVNTLGLSLDSPEIAEAANGNYSYLEAKIAQLGDKAAGAERFVQLAKDAQARVAERVRAEKETATKTVMDAVGGADNWKVVADFARANLDAEKIDAANAALSKGGFVAEAMAKHLLALASANPAVTVTGNPVSNPTAPAAPIVPAGPITLEQYKIEYRKLVDQMGISAAQRSPELKALNARVRK